MKSQITKFLRLLVELASLIGGVIVLLRAAWVGIYFPDSPHEHTLLLWAMILLFMGNPNK